MKNTVSLCLRVPAGGRTLQILKAKVSDGGKYSCVALNAAGEAHKHIYLTVFGQIVSAMVLLHSGCSVCCLQLTLIYLLPRSSSQHPRQ